MANAQTLEKLTKVFREVFDDDALVISTATTSQGIDDWDSLSNIRLMVALEGAFGIRLKASEMTVLAHVGALADLIERKLAA